MLCVGLLGEIGSYRSIRSHLPYLFFDIWRRINERQNHTNFFSFFFFFFINLTAACVFDDDFFSTCSMYVFFYRIWLLGACVNRPILVFPRMLPIGKTCCSEHARESINW